jgi:hypothetical protein
MMKRLHRKGERDTYLIEQARGRFLHEYAFERTDLLSALCGLLALFSPDEPLDLVPWPCDSQKYPQFAKCLSDWAQDFCLTFQGQAAGWAMDRAISTLRLWRNRTTLPKVLHWDTYYIRSSFHKAFPAGDPEYFNGSGESQADVIGEALDLRIPAWNLANGETEQEFRKRCKEAVQEHVEQRSCWIERRDFDSPFYVDALAMWQAGHELKEIQSRLSSGSWGPAENPYVETRDRFNVTEGAISKGITAAATFIEIDKHQHS